MPSIEVKGFNIAFLVLMLNLTGIFAIAQSYPHRVYIEEDGLPSSTINDIIQDHQGNLWFATRGGIASYDGRKWQTYSMGNGLKAMVYHALAVDDKGRIWAASYHTPEGISYFENGQWHTLPPFQSEERARLSLATATWDGETVVLQAKNQVILWRQNTWQPQQLDADTVFDVSQEDNRFYLGTNNGLYVLDQNGMTSLNPMIPEERRTILAMDTVVDKNGKLSLWLMGPHWMGVVRDGAYEETIKLDFTFAANASMLVTRESVFFGNETILYRYELKSPYFEPFKEVKLLESGGIRSIFQDRENSLWLGTARGAAKIPSFRFSNLNKEHGLLQSEVTSVIELEPGLMVLGHNEGLSILNSKTGEVKTIERRSPVPGLGPTSSLPGRVMDMTKDKDGTFWVAHSLEGLFKYNRQGELIESHRLAQVNELAIAVHKARDGSLWVGSNHNLQRYSRGKVRPVEQELVQSMVRRIHEGRDGTMYFSISNRGVVEKKGDKWQEFYSNKRPYREVYCILQDRPDRVLVGTLAGLKVLRDGRIVDFEENGFQLDRPVYILDKDHHGNIWVGTDSGIYKFDGQQARYFSIKHGLSGQETNRDGFCVDSRERIWIGTEGGVSVYHEERDRLPPPPLVQITGLEINGEATDLAKPMVLDHKKNNLTFTFRAPTFIDERFTRYTCRLKGFDKDWLASDRVENGVVRYTNLTPGDYVLEVKAANALDIWSDTTTSPSIQIRKPYWSTWWFRGISILFALAAGFSLFDYLSSKRYSTFLEQQVYERTRALEKEIAQHETAKSEIEALNQQLEARVRERTQELVATQNDLVETAHRAGMAEIATSMLHNVGNILNSVSTSSYFIKSTLDKSVTPSMVKANEILREQMDDLETFVRDNPKGKQLFHFYLSLGDKLTKEKADLNNHVDLLMEKITNIKDVVAQQHNYASGVYQSEKLPLGLMIETALKISGTSLESKGIRITTRVEPVPKVNIRRTKLIHTLINLLKNAGESIMVQRPQDPQIDIHLFREGDAIKLVVSDNGEGIVEENMPKLFRHGFTTKSEGHGFGLHSCATAMEEMNGSISVSSDGAGKGASFTLSFQLPEHLTNAG